MRRSGALLVLLVSLAAGARAQEAPAQQDAPHDAPEGSAQQDATPQRAPEGSVPQDATPDDPVQVDPAQEARALFERGLAYSRQERWGEALEYFRRSRALVDRPSSAFNMAVAQMRLGRPSAALRSLDDYLRLADPEREVERRAEARRLLELAMAALARVQLELSPGDAQVEVDGVPVAGEGSPRELSLDPGRHRLEASAEGYHRGVLELSLLDGERVAHALTLEAKPPPPPPPPPPPAPALQPALAAAPADRADDGGLLREPLFWVAVGVVAIATGVGIAVAVSDGDDDPMTGGNTGVVLQALGR